MVRLGAVDYENKIWFTLKEADTYLASPLKQNIKSTAKLLGVFLKASSSKARAKKIVFLPFTKTQSNLFSYVSKAFSHSSFFLFDNPKLVITKHLLSKGIKPTPYFDLIKRFDVLKTFWSWLKEKKGHTKKDLFYYRVRKRVIFLELFRIALTKYLKASEARLIVVPEDRSDLALLAIEVAKSLGIKSVSFQHGFYSDSKIKTMYSNHPESADLHLVYGRHFKDAYVSNGVPASKVKIIGAPWYGKLKKTEPQKPQVLYASQRLPERKFALSLLKTLDTDKIKVIDKLHPAETLREVAVHASALDGTGVEIVTGGEIEPLLETSSALLTISSTVFLGAVALGIPVGFFKAPEFDLKKYTIGSIITCEASLKAFVEDAVSGKLLFSHGRKKFEKDYLGPFRDFEKNMVKFFNSLL